MTLATSALEAAIQLGRATADGTAILDLEAQIKAQIGETIRYYNRKPYALSEVRGYTLTTVAAQTWYSTIDVSTGAGDQAVAGRTAVDTKDILSIDYMRENPGSSGFNERLTRKDYKEFERLFEGSTPSGPPTYWTYYAGQIGIWPTPDAAYTIYGAGLVKAVVPTSDSDTSVWLDEAEEMILAGACKRVCLKYLRNAERAKEFAVVEIDAEGRLQGEYVQKSSTRKLKVHD